MRPTFNLQFYQKKKIMKCTRLTHIKNELAKITFRKFESRYHASFWQEYNDRILVLRTFFLSMSRNLLWVIATILVTERYDRYEKFVEEKGGPVNNEVAQAIFPYAKVILYVLFATRLFINICGIKWPILFKGYFYVEMLI